MTREVAGYIAVILMVILTTVIQHNKRNEYKSKQNDKFKNSYYKGNNKKKLK